MKCKTLLLLIAAYGILVSSCAQKNEDLPDPANKSKPLLRDGGDDDDRPIIITRIFNHEFDPVVGAHLIFEYDNYEVAAFTDSEGLAQVELPVSAWWTYKVKVSGETYINTYLFLRDSLTYRNDTLSL